MDQTGRGVKEKDFQLPELGLGEVLVRMEVAAVNALDVMYVQGLCPMTKCLPSVPGLEGSGTVIATGSGPTTWGLKDKRVAVLATDPQLPGTWAQFIVAPASACYTLREDLSFEAGACLFVSPLTVCMFEECIDLSGHKAVILTASASALCHMILRSFKAKSVTCVWVTTSEVQRDRLSQAGETHVLHSGEENFESRLRDLCVELNITCALDACGGQVACSVFNAMQPGATLYAYSATNAEPILNNINTESLIHGRKRLVGLALLPWLSQKTFLQRASLVRRVQAHQDIYSSDVAMEFLLGDAPEALKYHRKFKSRGKVLFRMRTVYQKPTIPMGVEGQTFTQKFGSRLKTLWQKEPKAAEIEMGQVEGVSTSEDFHHLWNPSHQHEPDYVASFREDKDSSDNES